MGTSRKKRQGRIRIARSHAAPTNADCRELLAMAVAGDAAAENLVFAYLRQRMIPLARHVLRTSDVEDLVQDVLVIVHAKYRALVESCRLQDGASFERWWRRILYHRIGNDIRRRRFECGRCVPAECLSAIAGADAADRRCYTSELRDLLLRALQHLKTSQRAFLLQEASSTPGANAANGRNARYARRYRARKALREAIRQEAGFLVAGVCLLSQDAIMASVALAGTL